MRPDDECCGLCENFVLNNRAQANEGSGWCSAFEKYVHAASHPTVLFNPAQRGQMPERRAFVEKHKGE